MSVNIDELVEEYRALRGQRRGLDEAIKELRREETIVKDKIMDALDKLNLQSAGGEEFTVYKQKKTLVCVKDWDKFYQHILATGHFDLLQKRPAVLALADRAADGAEVPGVELGHFYDVSVRTKGAK